MKILNQINFILILLFVASLDCIAQSSEEILQSILDSTYHVNQDAIGIMVHVESPNNNISWTSAVGFSDKANNKILENNQPVLIASNTKTFVSATILKLVEKEQIELDQSIRKLITRKTRKKLKRSGYDLNQITVIHLLSHTSGITDYVDDTYFDYVNQNPDHQWTRDEQINLATLIAKPKEAGTIYGYGDINYLLLTEIIESKTNKPFYIAIRELLEFEKHQLNDTWFVQLENNPFKSLQLAQQYSSKFQYNSSEINPSWDLYGGGGIASTTKDLAKFFQLLFEGKIITNQEVLSKIYTYVLPKEATQNYCLGLFNIPSFFGENVYYHGGFWGTDVVYIPSLQTSISIFTLVREKRDINIHLNNELIKTLKTVHR